MGDENKPSVSSALQNPRSFDSAAAFANEALKVRASLFGSLSERIRTLSLGSLVVVWGVLSGEKAKSLLPTSMYPRIALLLITILAVIVLGLDILESCFAILKVDSLAGGRIRQSGTDHEAWEDRMRVTKVALGMLNLLLLCVVLGYLLILSTLSASSLLTLPVVHAQRNLANEYVGAWCGGNLNFGTYQCVDIEPEPLGSGIKVSYSFQDLAWNECDVTAFDDERLEANCMIERMKGHITAHRPEDSVMKFELNANRRTFPADLRRSSRHRKSRLNPMNLRQFQPLI